MIYNLILDVINFCINSHRLCHKAGSNSDVIHITVHQQEEHDIPDTVFPSVTQEINTDDDWDILADQVECVTSINLHDLCRMSSCLNLVMVLLENNTLEIALVCQPM